jgi:DNA (cytosine-5)-methyltransferase 1
MSKKSYKCGALFSGIGGFCLGFKEAHLQTSWAVEYDSSACETYSHNLPDVRILNRDIRDVSVKKDHIEPVDILHAGFPCQSFSQAGGRLGFDDPRGMLFFEIIRLLEEFKDKKPAIIVLENAPFLKYGEGGAWFIAIQKAIQKAGYWFRPENAREIDASVVTAVPQQRVRLFMVALSMEHFLSGRFDFPEQPHPSAKDLHDYIKFHDTVSDEYYLPPENRYYNMISNAVEDRDCIYQLRKYLVRIKERGVCPTLTANMGLGGHNVPFIMNNKGLRKLTEYECLRLQGFPENFEFPDSVPRAKRYTQIGNAVCVPVARLLAEKVKAKLDSRK